MTTTSVTITEKKSSKPINASESFTTTGDTDWIKFAAGPIAVQISGAATAITAQVQRSTEDPTGTANTAPAGDAITGNPATGIAPVVYDEPAGAWYRVVISALTGTPAKIVMSGIGA